MIPDPHSPWMFQRDEVDLLEEEIDDLYDLHPSPDGRVETMEHAAIAEQLETEERADAELAMQVELKWFVQAQQAGSGRSARPKHGPETPDLSCDTERSPFYEQLFRFSQNVCAHAELIYAQKEHALRGHAFRALLNVKMLPVKCANAFSEEAQDDPFARAVAKKELNLARLYLDRVLVSLAFMAAEGDLVARSFLAPGTQIKHILQQQLSRLFPDKRGTLF